MEHDAQFACKSDLGALHAAAFRHFERPALQAGKPRRSRQHDMRRLEERGSDHRVADLADTSIPVGLAGLIFLGGQPKIGTDRTRFSKAGRIVHRRSDRKSTRLNSSHVKISYAVFCLKKKKKA